MKTIEKEIEKSIDSQIEVSNPDHIECEALPHGTVIPYICRAEEKLFSKKAFQAYLQRTNNSKQYSSNLDDFHYLKSQFEAATPDEIQLLTEIDKIYNDGINAFDGASTEQLVSHDDVMQIIKYQERCLHAIKEKEFFIGGFIRFTLRGLKTVEYIVPYLTHNGQSLIPISLLNKIFNDIEWTKVHIAGIDVHYMRFLCDILQTFFHTDDTSVDCAPVDQIEEHCHEMFFDHWPDTSERLVNIVSNEKLPRLVLKRAKLNVKKTKTNAKKDSIRKPANKRKRDSDTVSKTKILFMVRFEFSFFSRYLTNVGKVQKCP